MGRDELPVTVIRSPRRRKTSAARVVDGQIEVRIPAWLSKAQECDVVAELVARVRRSRDTEARGTELVARAHRLAERYELPAPRTIRWVTNQRRRWGSCTRATGDIRISSRLRRAPGYVLDFVILHELAHLVEPNHGPAFRAIEARFPMRDRAEGFLDAMALGLAHPTHVAD